MLETFPISVLPFAGSPSLILGAMINVENKRSTLIRARLPGSLTNLEVTSNTVSLTNIMEPLETPVVEIRTTTYTVTQTVQVTSYYVEATRMLTTAFEPTGAETRLYIPAGILAAGIITGVSLLIMRRESVRI